MFRKLFVSSVFSFLCINFSFAEEFQGAEKQHTAGAPAFILGFTSCDIKDSTADIAQANIQAVVFNVGFEDLSCQISNGYMGPNGRPQGNCESAEFVDVPVQSIGAVTSTCLSGAPQGSYFRTQFLVRCISQTWPLGEGTWVGVSCD